MVFVNPWELILLGAGWLALVLFLAVVVLILWGVIVALYQRTVARRRNQTITRVKKRRHPRG